MYNTILSLAVLLLLLQGGHAPCTDIRNCVNEYISGNDFYFYRTWWNLTQVPSDIPAEARRVDLAGNAITSLPAGVFSHLSQCRILSVDNNKLTCVDRDAFKGMVSLALLFLFKNKISHVEPGTFRPLLKLSHLRLEQNEISSLSSRQTPDGTLQTVPPDGNISHIDIGTFLGPNSLRDIALYHNQLCTIKSGWFSGMYALERLNLMFNNISSIEKGAFDSLHSIKSIQLSNNRLSTLSPDLFSHSPRPLELILTFPLQPHEEGLLLNNPWNCTSLCWLKLETQNGTIKWSPFVAEPQCTDGALWASLRCSDEGESACSHNECCLSSTFQPQIAASLQEHTVVCTDSLLS